MQSQDTHISFEDIKGNELAIVRHFFKPNLFLLLPFFQILYLFVRKVHGEKSVAIDEGMMFAVGLCLVEAAGEAVHECDYRKII